MVLLNIVSGSYEGSLFGFESKISTENKMDAVKKQDYEKAAYCRDQEIDIRKEIAEENEKWEKSLKKKKKPRSLTNLMRSLPSHLF